MAKSELEFRNIIHAQMLFGERQVNLKTLDEALGVELIAHGNGVTLTGNAADVRLCEQILSSLYRIAKQNQGVSAADVAAALDEARKGEPITEKPANAIFVTSTKRVIAAKTDNQRNYVQAIRQNDVVFGVGPAGTGKTYLAMAMAVDALMRHQIKRIVLVRPAVEAGERLGFLPGDMAEKVNPYLRPLYDALYDMVDIERAQRWMTQGTIEVAPLAFMRGRTLNSAFVILDEAQNATIEQMKMFLTRLGFESKAVITGDLTQTDLGSDRPSGLKHALNILDNIDGIAINRFNEKDIVRHPLVQKIVLAYENSEKAEKCEDKVDLKKD